MPEVIRGAEEGVRRRAAGEAVRLELPNEQQHAAAALPVMDKALTGGRLLRRCALPVK